MSILHKKKLRLTIFLSTWIFFHKHSKFTRQQRKGETVPVTPLYHFQLLHRRLDITTAITVALEPITFGFKEQINNYQATRPPVKLLMKKMIFLKKACRSLLN